MVNVCPVFALLHTNSIAYPWCDPSIVVSRPLKSVGKALELFGKYQCKEYHLLATAKLHTFL